MKFLVVCNHGNCRSYQMARILKYSGHEAINVGADFSSKESMHEFAKWSDYIIWLSERHQPRNWFDNQEMDKVIAMPSIGRDRWGNPFNKELTDILIFHLREYVFPQLKLKNTINEQMVYNIYGKSFDWYKFGKIA